ncbi:MAG TPA: polysaccharide deacetylase family protein, partial [Clostridiales bacterium]|nr:polysaccharide deacetylase family protein [Clostridiales bacterium]
TTTAPTKPETPGPSDGSGKVVYLTFDDGPGQYTQELLNTLDKYNVKATFFVTHQYPSYEYMLKKEAERGHTVAIHSYSHNYAQIYKSEQAYFEDLDKMNAVIKSQTGKEADILRFPGGSSNTVSRNYNNGIMTRLTKSVEEKGYVYADWNVTSGDASGKALSSDQIANNVIEGMKKHQVSVVLQHDVKKNSVAAVDKIIRYGQANGYTFKAMTRDSYMAHHGVNN